MKRTKRIAFFIAALVLVSVCVSVTVYALTPRQPFADLTAADITDVGAVSGSTSDLIPLSGEETEELVSILREVVFYHKDADNFRRIEVSAQTKAWPMFVFHTTDGSLYHIAAGDDYFFVGSYFFTMEPCKQLDSLQALHQHILDSSHR